MSPTAAHAVHIYSVRAFHLLGEGSAGLVSHAFCITQVYDGPRRGGGRTASHIARSAKCRTVQQAPRAGRSLPGAISLATSVPAQHSRESGPLALSDRARSARGLACVLLVVFHAIGNEPTAGMHVARDSGLHFFAQFFTYVRMPLFSFLSGFVYAYHPVLDSTRAQFVLSKWRRLIVPMLTAATVTLIVE